MSEGKDNWSRPILVTGGHGKLAKGLAATRQMPVVTVGRSELDVTDEDGALRVLTTATPLVVINTAVRAGVDAAETDDGAMWQVNAVAPGRLARACKHLGVPMIHISTDYVFGARTNRPWREDDPVSPVNAYGRMKAAGESAVHEVGGRVCVVRVAWLFGFHDDFISRLLRTAKDRVSVAADQVGSPTPIVALAERLVLLAKLLSDFNAKVPDLLHIAGSPPVSRAEWVETIFRRLEGEGHSVPKVDRVSLSSFGSSAPRPLFSSLDCSRATLLFGTELDWRHG
jgi:dTDP-4-dehydrorhamnose reductase